MIYIETELPLSIDQVELEKAALQTLSFTQSPLENALTIVIGDDALLQRYNSEYLGIDSPTDVLSFPADYLDPDTQALYLGDIIISLPRAQQQAASGGYALVEELKLLVVHGVLHLLGYDHTEPEGTAHMQAAQDTVMAGLGSQNSPRLQS